MTVLVASEERRASRGAGAPRRLTVEFCGSASEYFRIWIAHLCLSVLTLGVYWPWARVRIKQYLYHHTRVDGSPFRYDAPPFAILVGELVATGLLLGSYLLTAFAPETAGFVWFLLLMAVPWIIVSANRLEANYTSYRGLRFRFWGSYGSALGALFGAAVLACTVVGLPWAYRQFKVFLVKNWSYGGVRAQLFLHGSRLVRPALAAGLIWAFGTGCALTSLVWGMQGHQVVSDWVLPATVLPFYLAHTLALSVFQAGAANRVWGGTRLGPLRFRSSLRGRELALLYLTNTVAVLGSFGLLVPWAGARLARYRANHLAVTIDGSWAEFTAADSPPAGALGSEMAQSLGIELPVLP